MQRRLLVPAILAGVGLAPPAVAQPAPAEAPQYRSSRPYAAEVDRQRRAQAEAEDPALRFDGGVDFRSQYIFRGYNVTSSGVIVQPYATLEYTAYKTENLAITPHVGVWFNFAEETAPEEPVHFHEFDAIGGVGVETGPFTLDFQYIYYTSPGEVFEDIHEIGVDVSYDDSPLWGESGPITGLNPSFALFYEAYDENDDDYNTYVGLGLEPALRAFNAGSVPVTLSFPLTLGGSYDGYYKDDDGHNANFGFWMAGIKAGVPLPRSGYPVTWSLEAEVNYVRLLADSTENANGGDSDDIVFRLGIRFE